MMTKTKTTIDSPPEGAPLLVDGPLSGRVLGDRYELHDLLGGGDTTAVYGGLDRVLKRAVAVRVLRSGDPAVQQGFEERSKAAASLSHPNVVSVFSIGMDDELSYVVREFVAGESVASLLRRSGPQSSDRTAVIVADVCAALVAAHEQGIVHGNLRPSNVLLTVDGRAKLAEFGIAPRVNDLNERAASSDGDAYLAPERLAGHRADGRGDVYSVGVLLYELLTQSTPAPLAVGSDGTRQIDLPSWRNPSVSPAVDAVVLRALSARPERRPAIADLAVELAAAAEPNVADDGARYASPALAYPTTAVHRVAADSAERPAARAVSLSVRLIGLFSVVVAATLLVVGVVAVQLTQSRLVRELDGRLVGVSVSFGESVGPAVQSPEQLPDAARSWLAAQSNPADQAVLVRLATGEVLTTSGAFNFATLPGGEELLSAEEARWWSLEVMGGEVRALTTPLRFGDQPAGTIVVASSTASIDDAVNGLARRIFIASFAGFGLAVILLTLLVRHMSRPLHRMAKEIEGIQAADDLSRRIEVTGPRDEVGVLGEAFNRTLGRLETAFASQQRFVAEASHELRTPLTVARGQLELIDDEKLDAEGRRSRLAALTELDRMGRVMADLLLLARLDEGLVLPAEEVEVELVAREAWLRTRGLHVGRVTVDVPEGIAVVADFERLLQVLTNLLGNAFRYAGASAQIVIRARARSHRVLIEVSDDGPGIAPEEQSRLFERFYRGGRARAGDGGAGLGLPIARSLVERMDGTLTVSSEPGAGTTVAIDLPAPSTNSRPTLPVVRRRSSTRRVL